MITKFQQFILEKISDKPIEDIEVYLSGMKKGLSDKLFFFSKIETDCLVDFGSADGSILREIHRIKPEIKLIGYDIDEQMLSISKSKSKEIYYTSDWNDVLNHIKGHNPSIMLSSVIHEVYSYSNSSQIKKFWTEQVFNPIFKYVIIRDMMPSIKYEHFNLKDLQKIKYYSDPKYLQEFESVWGPIEKDFRTLLHWLLKYSYTDNWKRELHENYVPITIETLKMKIPFDWKILYEEHFTYPYFKEKIHRDFDIELTEPTHLKMIIKH